jgi:pimeloyl-ACP methyl ester carboxylesterase
MENLLLLHGAIGSENTFTMLKTQLEENYKVYTLNFPGHGSREDIDTEFSIANFSSIVIDHIDSIGNEPVNIFGYSLGGYVALNVAYIAPSKVKRVMTFATIFNWNPETAAKQSGMLNVEKIEAKVPDFAKSLSEEHGEKWKQVLGNTASMLETLGTEKILNDAILQDIGHKVCISVGDRDKIVSLEESISAYRNLKNAELAVFPDTVHMFEYVDVHLLSTFILKFFLNK